jgi:glucose/mannose-6-phosphate isomerase
MILDDAATIAAVDVHRARDVIGAFPAQCREAVRLRVQPATRLARPRAIVVAGMGGSAASGDLLAACAADRLDIPVIVHRGYGLPSLVDDRDLVVVTSYSGDTAEALSAAETALERGAAIVAVTSGGRLAGVAAARRFPAVALPANLMPRMALGYLFFPLLDVLRAADLTVVKETEIDEALSVVELLAAQLGPDRPAADNEAKQLALALGDRIPVVYGGPLTGPIAYRWKTEFEENAKAFAAAGTLPEMNHNEIEAWRAPQAHRLHLLLLRDRHEGAEIARRYALLRELVGGSAGGVSEVWSRGASTLARLLGLAYLGQWASYYLAIKRSVDPWSVPTLDALKGRLRSAGGRDA